MRDQRPANGTENCEAQVGVVLVCAASEGAGTAEFSAVLWSMRRRRRVSRDPERDRFRCANRRCNTSVDKSA